MENIVQKVTKNQFILTTYQDLRKFVINNSFLFITVILLFLKSLIFISYVSSPTGTHMAWPKFSIDFTLYAAFILMLVSLAYIFNGRFQVYTLIFINFGLSLLNLFDLMYYRGFQGFISPYNLSQTGNLDNLSSAVISMTRFSDAMLFIDILVLLFIKKKNLHFNAKRKIRLSFILLILGAGIPLYYHFRYDVIEGGANKRYFYVSFSPQYNITNLSPIGFHIYDTYKYFESSKRLVLSEEDKSEIKDWYQAKAEYLPDNEYKGKLKGKNLILVQLESFESFIINQKTDGQEITPMLNKLLKNSLNFTQIYEQVKGGTSSDSDLIANTSTYPVKDGSTFFRFPDNKYNSMPVLMKKLGYYTSAFHPDGGGYWNWMPALQSMEFDKCTDATAFNIDETINLGLSDKSYLRQLKDMIIAQPQPFYSFFVTLSSHSPFEMPEETKELKLADNIEGSILGDYFHSVHYTDKYIGKFVEDLDQAGILDNSVLVIFGDHAGVTKYFKDKVDAIQPTEEWYPDDSKVPLLIYSKDLEGKEIRTIGGQVDILPTVAYLMGVEEKDYINTAMGRNLLKTDKSFAVLSSGKFVGEYQSEAEKQHAIQGLDISDKMLRSNYFEGYK